MQKLSEIVYASLFWLISGLVVWLAILPMAIIGLPIALMVRVLRQRFQVPPSNLAETEKQVQTDSQSRSANLSRSVLTSLLLTALVEVPGTLAAIVSLQPTRLTKEESISTQQPQAEKAYSESTTDTIAKAVEISIEENKSDR